MTSQLLYVPLRRTQNVPLGFNIVNYVEKEFHQTEGQTTIDADSLDRLKGRVQDVQPHISSIDVLNEYYAQLCNLIAKFPTDINTEFIWFGTLGYSESGPVKRSSTQFERLNVAYNIASLYSHIAYNQPLTDANGIKRAYNYFQLAAGAYNYIATQLIPLLDQAPPLDLEVATIQTLHYLCLAQAQEAFWLKAKLEGLKNTLIAKLSLAVSDFYLQAGEYANRSSAIKSEWVQHIICKRYHFLAATQYRASLDCLDKGKYGEEIGRLKDAQTACNMALANSKYVSSSVLKDVQELSQRIKSDLAGAEKDNDLIYLQTVPSSASLPPIVSAVMVKDVIPEVMNDPAQYLQSKNIKPLFDDILPYTIYEANNAYNERLNEYVQKNYVAKIEELTIKLHSALQKLNLPGSLEAIEKPMGVPQSLLLHSDEIRTKGGVSLLHGTINDIQKLYRESLHMLDEAREMLSYEEKEDAMMRNRQGTDRWVRATSKEAGADLWKALGNFENYLKSSETSDRLVREKFHKVERFLEIMCDGPRKLETYIPNSTVVHVDPYLEYNMQELHEALLKSRGIEYQRQQYINNLMFTIANTRMLPEIIAEYTRMSQHQNSHTQLDASKFEPIYMKHVKRIQEDNEKWLQQQVKDQDELLETIKELNERFLEIRDNDASSIERENAVQNLEVSYFKFGEILQNLDEGRKFYNSMIEQLRSYIDQCKEFVYQRRVQGRELESSISDSFERLNVNDGHAFEEEKSERGGSIIAPQARHPDIVNRVWSSTDEINFASSSPLSNTKTRTWNPEDGIKFS